jgi:hypothetical protein
VKLTTKHKHLHKACQDIVHGVQSLASTTNIARQWSMSFANSKHEHR